MKHTKSRILGTGTALVLTTAFTTSAFAEKLSHEMQRDRDYYGVVTDLACNGEQDAYQELLSAATDAKNPVAQNNMVWLYATDNCVVEDRDMAFAYGLQNEAAEAGYPIALNNQGNRLMKGLDDQRRDPEKAISYFDRAIAQDYGTSALALAEYYLEGEYIPQNYSKAVAYLRKARADRGEDDQYPDTDRISNLADKLDAVNASVTGIAPVSQTPRWVVEDFAASMDYVTNGRLNGAVSLLTDPVTGELRLNFYRVSNDPLIHFMGLSVEHANGSDQELHFGRCGANNCLQTLDFNEFTQATAVSIPIIPSQRENTLNAMKAGDLITFRYQSMDSYAKDKFSNYSLSLKGSRNAIEQIERMSAVIANEHNRPTVDFNNLDAAGENVLTPQQLGSPSTAKIIDSSASAAGAKFGGTPVTCFYAMSGVSPAGVQRELNRLDERSKQINTAMMSNPIGQVILQYTWGAVVFRRVSDTSTIELHSVIEQRDYYSGKTECNPDDFEYETVDAAIAAHIVRPNSRSETNVAHLEEIPDWRERILRPE